MRITHVTAPAASGGLESVLALLAGGHAARGHEVHVVAILDRVDEQHPLVLQLRGHGAHVSQVAPAPRDYMGERRMVRQALMEPWPDMVHTHGYRADVVDAGVARKLGIPSISTVHGFTGVGWRDGLYEWLQIRSLRQADCVVAVSNPIAERLRRSGVTPGKIRIVRNSYRFHGEPLTREAARKLLGLDASRYTVGWVGRLSHEKGPDVMLEAALQLERHGIAVSFVGEGPMRESLEKMAGERARANTIRFHGPIPGAGRLLRGFDLVALSSRTEGTPMVLLEAMAAGVPAVATNVGGIPDIVSSAEAALVPSGDPDAITAAVVASRDNPSEARARAIRAGERARLDLDYDRWLDSYEACYRFAMESRRGARR